MLNQRLLLNTSHILIDGLYESIPLLLSFMVISFGSSEKETGIIISLATMLSTFLGLYTVCISQHLGLLRSISLILFVYGIGFFTSAFSHTMYLTGFCFIIAIAGHSIFHNAAFTHLTTNSDRKYLGKTLGNFTAIGDIGRIPFASLAGFAAAASLSGVSGWRIVCLVYGLGAMAFAAYLFFSYSAENNQTALPNSCVMSPFPSFSLLRKRQCVLPITANMLDALAGDQLFTFLPYLLFAKGIDPKVIGVFALAFTLGCVLGKIVFGRMVDLFDTRKVFVISEAVRAILLVILIAGHQVYSIVGASLLLGIVTKGTIPVIQTIITEPLPDNHYYGDIFAISSFSRGTINILTPLLFGYTASVFSINWLYSFMAIASVCAIIPVLKMDTVLTETISAK